MGRKKIQQIVHEIHMGNWVEHMKFAQDISKIVQNKTLQLQKVEQAINDIAVTLKNNRSRNSKKN